MQEAKTEHVAGVFADRSCARRMMLTSESSTKEELRVPAEKGMLYIALDGMDQAWRHHACYKSCVLQIIIYCLLPSAN